MKDEQKNFWENSNQEKNDNQIQRKESNNATERDRERENYTAALIL